MPATFSQTYCLTAKLPFAMSPGNNHLSFDTEEATLPATHTHPSLSSVVGAGKYILIFSPKSIFIDVAWRCIYLDNVHSVSFKLINSLLFFCPSRILNGAFPYSFLSGIFHPVSLMKFILFSST